MGAQSIRSPRTTASGGGMPELCVQRVQARLRLLADLAAEIEALKRDPDARRRLQMNDPRVRATARAAANIAEWRLYLPEDCISAMIRDGWQWST